MDARPVLLALTVAATVWNLSSAAAQSWSSNNSTAPASTYDRYGQPVAPSAPSITQRTQNGFSETGSALRDGVEAGIRAAEQGFNNATAPAPTSNPFTAPANSSPTTSSARGGVSSPWTNTTTGNASSAPAWPTTPTGTAPPTTSRPGAVTVSPVDGGWSSIGTAVAAPPLLIPQAPPTTGFNPSTTSTGRSAPTSPSMASNNAQPLHSVLADPARSSTPTTTNSAPTTDNWATGWSDNSPNTGATIGRGTAASPTSSVRDSGLAPLQPPAGPTTSSNGNAAGIRNNDGWPDTNNWSQPAQPSLGFANGATATNRAVASGASNTLPATGSNQPTGQFAGQNGFPSTSGLTTGILNTSAQNPNINANQAGGNLPPIGRNQPTTVAATEPQPWMPLIASVLTLAGSLAANLYLGVSYLDARQKYQSLVRKTAETFRRVKAVAA